MRFPCLASFENSAKVGWIMKEESAVVSDSINKNRVSDQSSVSTVYYPLKPANALAATQACYFSCREAVLPGEALPSRHGAFPLPERIFLSTIPTARIPGPETFPRPKSP